MKQIFNVILLCLVALGVNAQTQYRQGFMRDTMTNADTSYLYPADAATAALATNFRELGVLAVTIVSDSLSGSTAGTATLQYCYDADCNYTYDAATLTLNGAATQVSRTEDTDFDALKFRIKIITSGTSSTYVRSYYSWKRKI